jgi:predicted GNAT family acetyltransferase
MAGERLRFPGYAEVSAVCTHPQHTGRGYAATLISALLKQMRERDETPILHVRPGNTRAVALYKRLGFAELRLLQLTFLRKA